MHFIDTVTIYIRAGSGGNGRVSFRQEKFVDRGGPDGGDGGNGGSVVMRASRNENTLAAFRYQKEVIAKDGQAGGESHKHGRSAAHLVVPVPVGTQITRKHDNVVLADLAEDGQEAVVAKGGRGGFGNAHFISSTRQAPKVAEKGEAGETFEALLELKMIADVGLVGLPNAGKSTLLSVVSNARPEIADYPFTTITPNLGVVDIADYGSLLFADIPGLIEGAAHGKGLGDDFLRHVERTSVLVHLVDAYQHDIVEAYQTVQAELAAYVTDLTERPQIVVITKVEGLDDEIIQDLAKQLRQAVPEQVPVFAISAQAHKGLDSLLFAIKDAVVAEKARAAELTAEHGPWSDVPVLTLGDNSRAFTVSKQGATYYITGRKIERFAAKTDFDNEFGVQRLRDIMRKMGILHELVRQKIEPGDRIIIGAHGEIEY
ncbi:MAG: GTPase ObgE [Candidatus Saccharimonadales bacterium]